MSEKCRQTQNDRMGQTEQIDVLLGELREIFHSTEIFAKI